MSFKLGGGKGVMSEPNIVPLIDVLLVLLIIFMVITPLVPKGLDTLVPQPSPPDARPDPTVEARTVVVQVTSGGGVKINQEDTSWDQLGPRLEEIFKTRAEKVAFVKGDENIQFAEVARAIDIMRNSGVEKVGLITARIEAGQ
jgi:biopolymer transport protein ExbD